MTMKVCHAREAAVVVGAAALLFFSAPLAFADVGSPATDLTSTATQTVSDTTSGTTQTVNDTTSGTTQTVNDTTSGTTQTVNDTTSGTTQTVSDTTSGTTQTVNDTTSGTTQTVSDTTSGRLGGLTFGPTTPSPSGIAIVGSAGGDHRLQAIGAVNVGHARRSLLAAEISRASTSAISLNDASSTGGCGAILHRGGGVISLPCGHPAPASGGASVLGVFLAMTGAGLLLLIGLALVMGGLGTTALAIDRLLGRMPSESRVTAN
jgi:hypothetical protein